jgi:hypothetical protein
VGKRIQEELLALAEWKHAHVRPSEHQDIEGKEDDRAPEVLEF